MSLKKRTIRRLPPKTREIARIMNDLESVLRKLKNRLPDIASLELDSQALVNARNMLSLRPARDQVKKAIQESADQEPLFPDDQPPAPAPGTEKRKRTGKKKELAGPEPAGPGPTADQDS